MGCGCSKKTTPSEYQAKRTAERLKAREDRAAAQEAFRKGRQERLLAQQRKPRAV